MCVKSILHANFQKNRRGVESTPPPPRSLRYGKKRGPKGVKIIYPPSAKMTLIDMSTTDTFVGVLEIKALDRYLLSFITAIISKISCVHVQY